MKIIISSNGYEIQVSDEDYDYLNQWKWLVHSSGYVRRSENINGTVKTFYMASVVLDRHNILHPHEVDHKDKNKLNMQFDNLRPATRSQNAINQNKKCSNNSGFKGVSYSKRYGYWQARITVKRLELWLGHHDTPEQAAKAYDIAAKIFFKEFAVLNFPDDR